MSQDTDGVNDVMDGGARMALTLAGQVGERLAREREQAAREARALADADAREGQARLAAGRTPLGPSSRRSSATPGGRRPPRSRSPTHSRSP